MWDSVPPDWHVVGIGDFNGDGIDDILWRNDDGTVQDWLGTGDSHFTNNGGTFSLQVPTDWKIFGTGNFNGHGGDDVLWRSDSGTVVDWLGNAVGGFNNNGSNSETWVPTDWTIAGVGDFNGDGRADILWRSDSGTVQDWLGTEAGGFTNNGATFSVAYRRIGRSSAPATSTEMAEPTSFGAATAAL